MVRYCEADDCKEKAYWKNEDDDFAKFCREHKEDSMKHIKWCIHDKIKQRCKECDGSDYCKHDKLKIQCKECGGSGICKHNKNKTQCKECGGSGICKHGKFLSQCKECGKHLFCKHNKRKTFCKECLGGAFCKHNKRKEYCKECGGSAFCKHDKHKKLCKECGGSAFCKHDKRKEYCKECGGSGLCKSSLCEITISNKKYEGYCLRCFMYTFKDKPVAKNYKTKEKDVIDRVKEKYPEFSWICDKTIQDGCSKRRPDMFLDMGQYVIIVEIDENQHEDYDCSCENKRVMQIWEDVGCRPIIFIRFNPDDYKDEEGKNVTSCWGENKHGILVIKKNKKEEWDFRINSLLEAIEYWSNNQPEEPTTIIQLFYDLN